MDSGLIAASIVNFIAPFTPFLIDSGKEGGKKLLETISEKGGETAWNKAQELWEKLKLHFENDPKVKGAIMMASAEPKDENSQKILTDILTIRLKENPQLAKEFFDLLGGQDAIQKILADRKSSVNDVQQQISGAGRQTIKADRNSRIKGVKQIKK